MLVGYTHRIIMLAGWKEGLIWIRRNWFGLIVIHVYEWVWLFKGFMLTFRRSGIFLLLCLITFLPFLCRNILSSWIIDFLHFFPSDLYSVRIRCFLWWCGEVGYLISACILRDGNGSNLTSGIVFEAGLWLIIVLGSSPKWRQQAWTRIVCLRLFLLFRRGLLVVNLLTVKPIYFFVPFECLFVLFLK